MRFWLFERQFGLDGLVQRDGEVPPLGRGEVLVALRAAALNYRDLVVMRGAHGRDVRPPLIPLSDAVGTVAAIGAGVEGFVEGDRVCPAFFQHWPGGPPPEDLARGRLGGPLDGVLATHRVFPATGLVRVPPGLSDPEAASLPCAGVTAWSALSEPAPVRPGETVLIQGTGGVALMALGLARVAGARVIATTSTPAKAERLAALGADRVIDRVATPDWARAVREATGGVGCDRVLELGGAETLHDSIKATRTGGTIVLIGNVSGNRAEVFLPLVLTRRLTLHSVSCGPRAAFEALNRALAHHTAVRPVIDSMFGFDEAPEAFRALERGGHFGKICISIAGDGAS